MMRGTRGLICGKCKKAVDRYSDQINCCVCEEVNHIECVNVSMEKLRELTDSKLIKQWKCEKCEVIVIPDIGQTSDGEIRNKEPTSEKGMIFMPDEKRYVPAEIVIQENLFLKEKNALLNMLIKEMSDKNRLLIEKLEKKELIQRENLNKAKINKNENQAVPTETDRAGGIDLPRSVEINKKYQQENPPKEKSQSSGNLLYSQVVSAEKMNRNQIERQTSNSNKGIENDFKVVNYRRQKKQSIVGTGQTDENTEFTAAESNVWVYVGRVNAGVTCENVTQYVKKKTSEDNIICEEIKIMGHNKAFKVGINSKHREKVYEPSFWPIGTTIRRYNINFFRDRQPRQEQTASFAA